MVDVINYYFKSITDKTVKLEESFVNSYFHECLGYKSVINSTRRMRIILDAKYNRADLNKVTTEKFQHLTATKIHRILHLLNEFEDLFNGTLGMWETTPVDF